MEESYAVVSIIIDVLLILLVGLAVLLLALLAEPFERGFFCDDETITYPYQDNTVSTLTVALVGLALPVVVIILVEVLTSRGSSSRVLLGKKSVSNRLVRVLRLIGVFFFGAGASQILVDSAKFWVGRLRPHFLAVCKPSADCETLAPSHGYITDYTCQGTDVDAIREARLSFPSGHSALSFYAAVFTVMYLQCAFTWNGSRLVRHVLQFLLLLTAWWTALTRITDNYHHWSDVLAGIAIGSLVAVLNVVFVSNLRSYKYRLRDQEQLPLMTSNTNRNASSPSPS